MDHALRDRLFRARMQGYSDRSRLSGTLLLATLALFWLAVLSTLVVLFTARAAGLSLGSAVAAVAALPGSFILGRRHARLLRRSL